MTAQRILPLACLALLPMMSGAGRAGCRPIVAHHKQQLVVGYTPVYQPQTYYVGQNLQLSAMEDRIVEKLVAKLQSQQLAAPAQPQTLPLTAEVDKWALVKANCAGCHSTNPKAIEHIDMTDLSALTCEQKLQMAAAALDGVMPPKKQLSPEVLGNLLGEIVGAKTVHQP